MKRLILAAMGLLSVAGMAAAADLPGRYPVNKAPIYSQVYRWTGFYVGINGGGGWGSSRWDGIATFDVSGGLFGVTGGYNYQFNQLVLGVEADIAWSGIDGTTNIACGTGCTTRNNWLSTVRGRVGYAFDRFMPYLTGGAAIGDIRATPPLGFPGGSITNLGWTLGVGFEVALIGNVTAKAEYLYVDLGDFNCGLNCGMLANGNVSFHANVVRGGFNFRF